MCYSFSSKSSEKGRCDSKGRKSSNEIHDKSPPEIWRDFHTSTSVGDKIYVFGGRGDQLGRYHSNKEIYDNSIYEFDAGKSTWAKVAVSGLKPYGRRSHSAIALGRYVYIFGGYNGIEKKHFGDLWRFDTVARRWKKLDVPGVGPCARRRQSWSLLGTQAIIFGGTCPISGSLHDETVDDEYNLQDLSDLYVLDFAPSLKTLCKTVVLRNGIGYGELPKDLRAELESMKPECTMSRCMTGLSQG